MVCLWLPVGSPALPCLPASSRAGHHPPYSVRNGAFHRLPRAQHVHDTCGGSGSLHLSLSMTPTTRARAARAAHAPSSAAYLPHHRSSPRRTRHRHYYYPAPLLTYHHAYASPRSDVRQPCLFPTSLILLSIQPTSAAFGWTDSARVGLLGTGRAVALAFRTCGVFSRLATSLPIYANNLSRRCAINSSGRLRTFGLVHAVPYICGAPSRVARRVALVLPYSLLPRHCPLPLLPHHLLLRCVLPCA